MQVRLGLLFLFLPALCPFCLNFHQREARCFSVGKDGYFVSVGFSRLAFGNCCPQLPHTTPTGRVCCFAGVVPLPGPQSRTQGHTGASLVFLRRTSLPLPLKVEGLDIVCLVCQVFHPEKPGAFPQEKTDTSYPRASLGSCLWQPLATTGSHGSNRACSGLRWCRSPTRISKPHTALHRASCGFVSQNEFTPPPKGGGAGYHLSWVGRVGSVRSKPGHAGSTGPTLFLAGAGSPTRPPKTAHRLSQGQVWFSPSFPGALLLR